MTEGVTRSGGPASDAGQMSESYDLIVVGGGPGGYTAAIRARQLGLRCAMVERAHLGGTCLNWGCIPTKALLHAAEAKHVAESLTGLGLAAGKVEVDIKAVVRRSRQIATRLAKGVGFLMKKNGVEVVEGTARLISAGEVLVTTADGEVTLSAPKVILATGARSRELPGLEVDGNGIITFREAMLPEEVPASLLVVGAGAIGMEFASFYTDLGTAVTVVEVADRILPQEDAEISTLAHEGFAKRGIQIHTGSRVVSAASDRDGMTAIVDLGHGQELPTTVDKILVAVGITGNVEDLGLEEVGVAVDRGHIVTNGCGETSCGSVYAIGDVAGPPWLAHKASHEAVGCVERIAGRDDVRPLDPLLVPACTYSRPQVASVGWTEEKARAAGYEVRVGRFPYRANGMALAIDDKAGLVKTVVDAKTGELLGAHLIGTGVTELIQGFAIARTLEARDVDVIEAIFPHPTLSEMIHESLLDSAGRALNL